MAAVGGEATHLAWSPDGGKIRFTRNDLLWEISANGSNLHQLLAGWRGSAPQCCGRWTPDGKFFIFQSQSRGLFLGGAELRALDERHGHFRRPPSEPYPLAAGPVRWSWPIPSLDGKAIFARGIIFRGELSRVDVRTHRFEPFLSRNFRTGPLVLQRRPVRGACFLPRGHPLESQPGWKQPRATE